MAAMAYLTQPSQVDATAPASSSFRLCPVGSHRPLTIHVKLARPCWKSFLPELEAREMAPYHTSLLRALVAAVGG